MGGIFVITGMIFHEILIFLLTQTIKIRLLHEKNLSQSKERRICPLKYSQNRSLASSVIKIRACWWDLCMVRPLLFWRGNLRAAHAGTILFCAENGGNPQRLSPQPVEGGFQSSLANTEALPFPAVHQDQAPCAGVEINDLLLVLWCSPWHCFALLHKDSQIISGAGRGQSRLSPLPGGSFHVALLWRCRDIADSWLQWWGASSGAIWTDVWMGPASVWAFKAWIFQGRSLGRFSPRVFHEFL